MLQGYIYKYQVLGLKDTTSSGSGLIIVGESDGSPIGLIVSDPDTVTTRA